MNNDNPSNSRRKFLLTGLMGIGSLGAMRANIIADPSLEQDKNAAVEMIKMLTPDGKLVEVPADVVQRVTTHQRSTISELKAWVNVNPIHTESNKSSDHEG